jgi:hypothetical protein
MSNDKPDPKRLLAIIVGFFWVPVAIGLFFSVYVWGSIQAGSLLVGIVFGWSLAHTAWGSKEWDWKGYVGVLGAVVGGAGVDYLFHTGYVGWFWIGIFIGFFSNLSLRVLRNEIPTLVGKKSETSHAA